MGMPLVEREMLFDAVEEGEQALCWFPHTFRHWYPEMTDDDYLSMLQEALADLITRGYVNYHHVLFPDGALSEDVPLDEAVSVVRAATAWLDPPEGGGWFVPTDEGIRICKETDIPYLRPAEILDFVGSCERRNLAVYSINSFESDDGMLNFSTLERHGFSDSPGDTWMEFRANCNKRALEYLSSIRDRADLVFDPTPTSEKGPDLVFRSRKSRSDL